MESQKQKTLFSNVLAAMQERFEEPEMSVQESRWDVNPGEASLLEPRHGKKMAYTFAEIKNEKMPSTPIIAVYLDDPNPMGYPFGEPAYLESYWTFNQKLLDRGYQMIIARGPKSYLGRMRFTGGWRVTSETTVEPVAEAFTAKIIYRKGYQLITTAADHVVNNMDLDSVCVNKLLTYELFGKFMAPCFPINSNNWQEVLTRITTDRVVLKPIGGQEGNGIVVKFKTDMTAEDLNPGHGAYLAQEFVDSSAGIPGLVSGLHDLRLFVFNGQVKMAEIRQPKKGSFLANMAQGGSLFQVALEKIPASAIDFAKHVDATFAKYTPRVYSVDMMYDGTKPYLVELNSQPGLPWREWEQFDHYYTKLHQYILDALLSE